MATGQVSLGLKLQDLKSESEIRNISPRPEYFKGEWLIGFGWDHHKWPRPVLPTKKTLDSSFPETPILLSRIDGHASWINSAAIRKLEKLGYDLSVKTNGGQIERDAEGETTGILFEQAHIKALSMLPSFNLAQMKIHLIEAIRIFNAAGFTHVRDLSMDSTTAGLLVEIYRENKLSLCLEGFVTAEIITDLERAFNELLSCRQNDCPQLRFPGLKIFTDGSLGSRTAFISKNYVNSNQNGRMAWTKAEIKEAIRFCWTRQVDIAVHVIGDLAARIVVEAAREVSAEGLIGKIHLEHVQVLNAEIVRLMKPLHVHCHMQPCHWLSDKGWVKSVIGDLARDLFQWELLRKNKIPFFFGSDSPIERPSLRRNFEALNDATLCGIPELKADARAYHSHPDKTWSPSHTIYNSGSIEAVYFQGRRIV